MNIYIELHIYREKEGLERKGMANMLHVFKYSKQTIMQVYRSKTIKITRENNDIHT